MVDIKNEIIGKFPALKMRSPMLKKSLFKIAQKIIHEETINDFLTQSSHLEGFEFVEAVLDYFAFDFSYSSNDIENIPATGRVVIIANHPLGALDAMCLLKLVSIVRKDVRIVANDFLSGVTALDSLMIKIDNFKKTQSKENIKNIYKSLENEEAVILFPAGEVSRVSPYGIRDGKWQKGFLKFAKKSNSPILPILVDAKNSKTFYTVSILNKTFSTILLSSEMFKQKDKNISLKIGKLIPNKHILLDGVDRDSLVKLYRKHTYGLKKGKKLFFQTQNSIALSESKQSIKKELKDSELLGRTSDGKFIYLCSYQSDSAILKELGRLREISFRKVNEGVNKKRDTDKYDRYYQHIVLWDEDDLEIVGAYRIADAKTVLQKYGFDGFYSNTLFEFQESFKPYLENAIELGRSFVQPKYWGTRALDYLWYGIGAYLKKNQHIKYMFGSVSLSASLPFEAHCLIVNFYTNYFEADDEIVKPKDSFEYDHKNEDMLDIVTSRNYKKDFLLLKESLKLLDSSVPALYKQYGDLCEDGGVTFHGFNVDKDFSNCIDGFIMADVSKIKKSKKVRYLT